MPEAEPNSGEGAGRVLTAYLGETDGARREVLLEELLLQHAAPVIRRTVRLRLGYGDEVMADDLFNEIMARILGRLRGLVAGGGEASIDDFPAYVNRVSRNACHDHLRSRYPQRYLLSNRIRYLAEHNPRFRLIRTAEGSLCGLIDKGEPLGRGETPGDDEIVEAVLRKGLGTGQPLAGLAAAIIRSAGGLLEMDRLVGLVGRLAGIGDVASESIDAPGSTLPARLSDARPSTERMIEEADRLRRIWNLILDLSPMERAIVMLGRVDAAGEDLWSLMLEGGIASIGEVAASIGMTVSGFAALALSIPMDAATLAAHLGVERRQVIRGRFRAFQRLRRALGSDKGVK